jgi:O-methyltransferase involved in polyketide biosynthesis
LFSRLAGGDLDSTDVGADELAFGVTNVFASRTVLFDGFFADAATAGIRQAAPHSG